MSTKDVIIKDGKVMEALMSGLFRIELDDREEKTEVFGALSGKMRKFRIKVLVGDKVRVILDSYGGKGRIIKRL